jgi:RimJ/RimL family protein N-acetyltransferase
MRPPSSWETSRLVARPATLRDAQVMFDHYASDPAVIRVHPHKVDLGYAIVRRYWRQGLMSEALRWIIEWAFAQPGIYRVWATCDVDNVASAGVLERVGMQREGVLRRWLVHPNKNDAPSDSFCYSIVRGSEGRPNSN